MELPPYREMPPEVRLRLRSRVLPSLTARPAPRGPYVVAAAIVVVATIALALLMSPARNAAPPAGQLSVAPTTDPGLAAMQRMAHCKHPTPGGWVTGAYLVRRNGDGVQLAAKFDRRTLGVCLIPAHQPPPTPWSEVVLHQAGAGTYQAMHDNGLVYGLLSPEVSSVTVNGAPAVVDSGTFIAEVDTPGTVTVVTRDAQGKVLNQGTIA